jgi:DNA-binding XRE family transcriptional regulator
MTTPARTDTPVSVPRSQYEWGRASELRSRRNYFGLNQHEFAAEMGMSRRSLQAMEVGRDAIPASLWSALDTLTDRFDDEVETLVACLDSSKIVLRASRNDSAWDRMVRARALHEVGGTRRVTSADDESAIREMQEEERTL